MFADIVDMKEIVQHFLLFILRAGSRASKVLLFRPLFYSIPLGVLEKTATFQNLEWSKKYFYIELRHFSN